MDEINSQSRNFALSTVARKTHVVIYGITSKIDSDRSFHLIHRLLAADCVVAVIVKIHFYSSFLSYFLSSRFLLVCLSFRSAGECRSFQYLAQDWFSNVCDVSNARESSAKWRCCRKDPPIPLRPSRLAFNRLGSSSLCVGDHYCSLRRQVSPLYFYSHKFNPILV